MGDDNDLRLNTLARFSKDSTRLALEEHGHCEVPAGCGGVVLRWINPNKGLPFLLQIHTKAEVEAFIDGAPPTSARPLIPPGRRVLALHLSEIPVEKPTLVSRLRKSSASGGVFMFVAYRDPKPGPSEKTVAFLSAADGTWRYTKDRPLDDSWRLPDFDHASWDTMIEAEMSKPGDQEPGRYFFDKLIEAGTRPLGVPQPAEEIWVRREFEVENP
jgi:hypothetical protein